MYKYARRFSSGRNNSRFDRSNRPSHRGKRFSGKNFGTGNRGENRRSRFGRSKLEGKVDIFIKKASQVPETSIYTPNISFDNLPIDARLKQNIAKKGYKNPTPIQDQAIVPILEGRDLIGLASTGTGKTAAFLIPVIDKMLKNPNERTIVIAPTRELAAQINEEFKEFSRGFNLFSTLVIGGAGFGRQVEGLKRNPDIVIATPGRLKDLIERNIVRMDTFSIFILDEVDLMVDIGFIHEVKFFISLLPKKRQSLFFSATIPEKVLGILQNFVKEPVRVSVKKQETSENVDQDVVRVINKEQKIEQLHQLLIKDGFTKVMIFGRTKHGIERLTRQLTERGFRVGAIHGNKRQAHRLRTLQSFKQNNIQVLLATDVASRGLDIDNVTHVINYDLPETYEDYIHRIGRTGRANRRGVALTFVE